MAYTIKILHLGTIIRKKSNMLWKCGSDELKAFPLLSFLIEGNGMKLLVDTGGSDPDGVKWMPYDRPCDQDLPSSLARCGVRTDEIDAVLFTHLHWDHAGGNLCLTNATFYVQKAEFLTCRESLQPGYDHEQVLASDYVLLDGDTKDVFPGISVLFTPGHSIGSQSILLDTVTGPVVLAGDLIPTYENLSFKTPNGVLYDPEVICHSMNRIVDLGITVIPGHDHE